MVEVSEIKSDSTPSPPPLEMNLDFDIPSPRTYLAKLRARLEKSRNYTSSRSKHLSPELSSSRKRRVTHSLPFKASNFLTSNETEMPKSHGSEECSNSDLSSLSSSSSSTSLSTGAIQTGVASTRTAQPPNQFSLSPTTKGVLGGRVTAWDQNVHLSTNGAPPLSRQSTHHHHRHAGVALPGGGSHEGRNDLVSSLQTINGQLGELLSRITPQPLTANSTATGVTSHPQSRYTPSPTPFTVGDMGEPVLKTPALMNTSS